MLCFNAENNGLRCHIGQNHFIKNIANAVDTLVSNIYSIMTVRDTNLNEHIKLSSLASFEKNLRIIRSLIIPSLIRFMILSGLLKMKSNRLSSVDETINYLILHESDRIN